MIAPQPHPKALGSWGGRSRGSPPFPGGAELSPWGDMGTPLLGSPPALHACPPPSPTVPARTSRQVPWALKTRLHPAQEPHIHPILALQSPRNVNFVGRRGWSGGKWKLGSHRGCPKTLRPCWYPDLCPSVCPTPGGAFVFCVCLYLYLCPARFPPPHPCPPLPARPCPDHPTLSRFSPLSPHPQLSTPLPLPFVVVCMALQLRKKGEEPHMTEVAQRAG